MKRLGLGSAAILLVLAALTSRPVHACLIGSPPPPLCNTALCQSVCASQGLSGGTCWYHACTVSCTCLN